MIEPTKWYLGSTSTYQNLKGADYYNFERGITVYSGHTTNFIGNVGLIYPSDYVYTYAYGVDNTCYTNGYNCQNGNKISGWMYNIFGGDQWTLSSYSSIPSCAFDINSSGHVGYNGIDCSLSRKLGVHPVLYLRSGIKLVDGDGSQENPYQLGM